MLLVPIVAEVAMHVLEKVEMDKTTTSHYTLITPRCPTVYMVQSYEFSP